MSITRSSTSRSVARGFAPDEVTSPRETGHVSQRSIKLRRQLGSEVRRVIPCHDREAVGIVTGIAFAKLARVAKPRSRPRSTQRPLRKLTSLAKSLMASAGSPNAASAAYHPPMGIFNRFRNDVARVGASLEPVLGGTLTGPKSDGITWTIPGTRKDRAVRVDLNHMHGIFGIACAVKELSINYVNIEEEQSIFAGDAPYIAPKLKMSTQWDAAALWELLPETTRHTLIKMLEPAKSSMRLGTREVSMLLGPAALLRQPDAADVIERELDQLLGVATAIEMYWDVDPSTVGAGRTTHVPRPHPEPPASLPVQARDAAAIAARARPARDAMLQRFASERIEAFPAADAIREGHTVKDRVVLLPSMAPSTWASDNGHKTIGVGEVERCWYFVRADESGFTRVLRAVERYESATGTNLGDAAYEVIGRFVGEPMMVVVGDKGVQIGHKVAVLGVLIGDRVFIDATQSVGADSLFEGERD